MIITQDVNKAMDNKAKKPFIEGNARLASLIGGALHGNDDVADGLAGHSVEIGKRDHVRGTVLAEKVPVHQRDSPVIHEQYAEVPIVKL